MTNPTATLRSPYKSLFLATRTGDVDLAQTALDQGASTSRRNANGLTPFLSAAAYGKLNVLKLLAPLSDTSAVDKFQDNALMIAAHGGQASCVAFLSTHLDPTLKAQGDHGYTALDQAAHYDSISCIRTLLPFFKQEHLPLLESAYERTSINSGPKSNRCAHAILLHTLPLLDAKAPINQKILDSYLLDASYHGNSEAVRTLLSFGANPKFSGLDGITSLMKACQSGQVDTISLLLPHSDLNAFTDQHKSNALTYAFSQGHAPAAELLIRAGALPSPLPLRDGWTPLIYASKFNARLVELAIPISAPNAQTEFGLTALMMATTLDRLDCIERLLPISDLSLTDNQKKQTAMEMTRSPQARALFEQHLLSIGTQGAQQPTRSRRPNL